MTSSEDRAATHPFALLARHRLVPVVEIPDVAAAVPVGRALVAGGLPCIEVTFRTPAAAEIALATAASGGTIDVSPTPRTP